MARYRKCADVSPEIWPPRTRGKRIMSGVSARHLATVQQKNRPFWSFTVPSRWSIHFLSENTTLRPNVGPMLAHRLRRRPNVGPTLARCFWAGCLPLANWGQISLVISWSVKFFTWWWTIAGLIQAQLRRRLANIKPYFIISYFGPGLW